MPPSPASPVPVLRRNQGTVLVLPTCLRNLILSLFSATLRLLLRFPLETLSALDTRSYTSHIAPYSAVCVSTRISLIPSFLFETDTAYATYPRPSLTRLSFAAIP
jgi:hypothetical protein